MPEISSLAPMDLDHLQERARKLAQDKSSLQLILSLINKVSGAQGLENMIETLLSNILNVLGGVNIILYYRLENEFYYADLFGKREKLSGIEDDLVNRVLTSGQPFEQEQKFDDTRMLTPEFTKAYTWVFPLLAGSELIGVIKLESLQMGMRELYASLPTFFTYVATLLKNNLGAEALRKSEEKFRTLVNNLNVGVYRAANAQDTLLQANPALARILGFDSFEEFMETPISEFYLHAEDRQRFVEEIRKKGKVKELELSLRKKDGTPVSCSISANPQFDENQQFKWVDGVIEDISERRKIEDERGRLARQLEGVNLLQQGLLNPIPLAAKLSDITEGIVRHFKVDFCRIWLIHPGDLCDLGCVHAERTTGPHVCLHREKCLHLLASSGRYPITEGSLHRRVPFDCYKIGQIASGIEHKFLTNDVTRDPRIHDHQWARELELVSFAGYQLRVPDGELIGVLACFSQRTITPAEDAMLDGLSSALALSIQQDAAKESLHETTDFLNTLLESLPLPVFYKDRDCRYIGFNKAYEKFLGKTHAQIYGKTIFDFCSPKELAEIIHAKDLELLQNQETQIYEAEVTGSQGDLHYVIFHKATFTDKQGQVLGLIGALLDITALKQAEEALHFQTTMLEEEIAERQTAQENLQEQAVQLEHEVEKRQKAQDDLEKLNEKLEQRVQARTAELHKKNAEIQQSYDELQRAQSQLLQQDKMASIGQLAAGVAHEINNPMGFIISNLKSLEKYATRLTAYLDSGESYLAGCEPAIQEYFRQERRQQKIDRICADLPDLIAESHEGAERVKRIVQDLKSFSRIDTADFAYSDIIGGLESTLSIAANELKYKANIIKEYTQLPPVWCNMGQLNQVFLNLLVNSAHAIKSRGEIRISTRQNQNFVCITISDTGGGIPAENIRRIFDPFFTTKEVGKGTGLGLAIAYDIVVNKHGGRIEVASEPGQGTSFTLNLPINATDTPLPQNPHY